MSESRKFKVEIKIRLADELKAWEERKVEATLRVEKGQDNRWTVVGSDPAIHLSDAVRLIAKAIHPEAVECRWNFEGIDQGHYFEVD
jgi:hypothetical protein